MIQDHRNYTRDLHEECDVCVIGSGAGGAVAAKELAEKGFSVVLLEEGGHFTRENWNGKPYFSMTHMWRNGGGTMTLGLPGVSVPAGRCIGGTTTINSCTCFRTPEKVMRQWRQEFGLTRTDGKSLSPYFDRVEKEISVTELSWDVLGNCAAIVRRGAEKLGLNCRPLRHNVKNCKGCGTCQFGCLEKAKQSMDVTYVPKADTAGARIYADCRVDGIDIRKGVARGVKGSLLDPETGAARHAFTVNARVVVASCGALMTPALLKRSGVHNKNIGRHLQIHPCARVAAVMDETVEGWKGVSQGAYIDDFEDEGIMLEGIFVHPAIFLAALPGFGHAFKEQAFNFSKIAAFGVMVHDSSEGRVYRNRKDMVVATYRLTREDAEKLKRGIAYTARIFFAAGARRVLVPIAGVPSLESEAEVERLLAMKLKPIHFSEIFAFHPLGSCRMAAAKKQGVVDESGRLFDVENLYIADGSIVPTSLGVNPQITIMALATRIAEGIAAGLPGRAG